MSGNIAVWKDTKKTITRLRIGHTSLNDCLRIIGKHQNGLCIQCGEVENVKHVLLICKKYSEERKALEKATKNKMSLKNLLRMPGDQVVIKAVLGFLKETQLLGRI